MLPSAFLSSASLPLAFGPSAVFGGLDPAAAAAAAAAAFKAAPQMFAAGAPAAPVLGPWGFFPTQPAPALFVPVAEAAAEVKAEAAAEQQQPAGSAEQPAVAAA